MDFIFLFFLILKSTFQSNAWPLETCVHCKKKRSETLAAYFGVAFPYIIGEILKTIPPLPYMQIGNNIFIKTKEKALWDWSSMKVMNNHVTSKKENQDSKDII